jgi:predicted MFS family arabinose efflux permease
MLQTILRAHGSATPPVWRMALSGLCASLVGIGLSRFAYTPLLPQLIAAHWFAPAQAAYIGAANLAGYLVGALLAQPLMERLRAATLLRVMMLAVSVSFLACGIQAPVAWFFLWRFVAGLAGGIIMVAVAPTILSHVPPTRRGLTSGAIFVGIGCGVVISATVVPVFMRWGVSQTWMGLGLVAFLLCLIAWSGWPHADHAAPAPPGTRALFHAAMSGSTALRALYFEYALNAVGLVPHMVFLVDFIERGLGQGLGMGSRDWLLFGLGAMVGPVIFGAIADRIGFRRALRGAFLFQAAAVAVLAIDAGTIALIVSSFVIGAFVPGIVPLVLGRVHELVARDSALQKTAWSLCTTAFALGQAVGAYGFSYIFAHTTDAYGLIFMLGGGALIVAASIVSGMAWAH